jgi:dTDP-4-amino-4,6-dideoxygalactose transaminase
VGSLGDAGCFSFYPAKNLGAWGDGGAVVTRDPEVADRVRLLRAHGERPRYRHRLVGTTARLHAVQAAILRVKLRRLDTWNDARRRLAGELTGALVETAATPPSAPDPHHDHVYHQYVITCRERDALRHRLAGHDIPTAVHYPVPIHLSDAFRGCGPKPGGLPVAEQLAGRVCSLPIYPGMQSLAVQRIGLAVEAASSRSEAA